MEEYLKNFDYYSLSRKQLHDVSILLYPQDASFDDYRSWSKALFIQAIRVYLIYSTEEQKKDAYEYLLQVPQKRVKT